MTSHSLAFTLNARAVVVTVEPHELLLDMMRSRFGLTGAKRSCDVQVCGACTILVDNEPVSACCTLAIDVDGRDVLTVEGFAQQDEFAEFEDAFTRHAAVQCGFCTSGMLLTAKSLLDSGELTVDEENIKRNLSGNLCRCTGYRGIVDAVKDIARSRGRGSTI